MQTNIIFHSIRLTLCFQQAGEIDNLTVKLGQSNLIVLCRFHVGTGIPGVAPHYTPSPTPSKQPRFPTGSIKPWFHTEGKLAAALIIPSSWGSQLTCDVTRIKHIFWRHCRGDRSNTAIYSLVKLAPATYFLAPLPGKTELLLQGESLTPNHFTLLFVLLSLFLFSLVCSLYQKHKKISSFLFSNYYYD